jgi:hypothetical protein
MHWEHTHKGLAAVYDTRTSQGMRGSQIVTSIFARIMPKECGAYYLIVTNDWGRTNIRAETEAQGKAIVEAMWALENH